MLSYRPRQAGSDLQSLYLGSLQMYRAVFSFRIDTAILRLHLHAQPNNGHLFVKIHISHRTRIYEQLHETVTSHGGEARRAWL